MFEKLVKEVGPDTKLRFSGYGEPFMNKHLERFLSYDTESPLSIITNGSLIHKYGITKLLEHNLECIEISADSHRKEIYEKIRVGLPFEVVMDNIYKLVELRDKMGVDTKIMVSVIDQPSKNPQIEATVDHFERIVDKVLVRKYVTWGVLPTEDCGEVPEKRTPCPYPWERLMIDPAGNYRLCPYDDQKLIKPLGHVFDDTVEEVWNSDRMNKIRSGHEGGEFGTVELCSQCTDWAYRSWTHNYRSALKDASN